MSPVERYGGRAMTTAIWALVGIIAFFLLTEHQAHLFGILPWLFLLACPVMHRLMHRGHHGHHGGAQDASSSPSESTDGSEAHAHHGGPS